MPMKVMLLSLHHHTKGNYLFEVWTINQHGIKIVNHFMMCPKRRYSISHYIGAPSQLQNKKWPSKGFISLNGINIIIFLYLRYKFRIQSDGFHSKHGRERK